MLIRRRDLEGIRTGAIRLAFRRWRRPSVRKGGTLLTAIGEVQIKDVSAVTSDEITLLDAERVGYDSREDLLTELARRRDGQLYRIEFGSLRPDPRVALRARPVSEEREMEDVLTKLKNIDARSRIGPWTMSTIELLAAHPGTPAGELCELVGQKREVFKRNVRKLKGLGLTESLKVGYRLSPRGASLLERVHSKGRTDA